VNVLVLAACLLAGEYLLRVALSVPRNDAERVEAVSGLPGAPPPQSWNVETSDAVAARRTEGQPSRWTNRVLIFGGSTVRGWHVDDRDTIASHLQSVLLARGSALRVDNFGADGVAGAYSVDWLKSLTSDASPGAGDVVIIYLGVNDAGLTFALRSPLDRVAGRAPLLGEALTWLGDESVLAARTMSLLGKGAITVLPDEVERLRAALVDAESWVRSRGAALLVVLQPHLFSKADPNDYERELARLYGPGLRRAVDEAYRLIEPVVRSMPHHLVAVDAMDGLQPSPYLDWMHVNASGNARVADVLTPAVVELVGGS
jgi:lysophospholipase L1-like esterase